MRDGKFRQDLYYRLNVIELRMPALRERREDIGLLADEFLRRSASAGKVPNLSEAALAALEAYSFPGNVRELENILERALALSTGAMIEPDDLQLIAAVEGAGEAAADFSGLPLQEHLDRVEKDAILQALEKTRYNRTAAAKLLGITFRALRYRMDRLGIN